MNRSEAGNDVDERRLGLAAAFGAYTGKCCDQPASHREPRASTHESWLTQAAHSSQTTTARLRDFPWHKLGKFNRQPHELACSGRIAELLNQGRPFDPLTDHDSSFRGEAIWISVLIVSLRYY